VPKRGWDQRCMDTHTPVRRKPEWCHPAALIDHIDRQRRRGSHLWLVKMLLFVTRVSHRPWYKHKSKCFCLALIIINRVASSLSCLSDTNWCDHNYIILKLGFEFILELEDSLKNLILRFRKNNNIWIWKVCK